MSHVTVFYKCVCMKTEVRLDVPERAPALDVVAWVEDVVVPRVADSHLVRGAHGCRESTMEYLKLPVPPSGLTGGQP